MSIGGVSGASLSSAAGIEQLIRLTLESERQPVVRLQEEKSNLEIKQAIYTDIKLKAEALRSSLQDIIGTSDTAPKGGALNEYAATLNTSGGGTHALDVSVDNNNTSISAATYNITVNTLATADSYSSTQQADTTSALGLSGNLIINGQTIAVATADSLTVIRDAINNVDFKGASVEEVSASIVDNKLVLTSVNTGTDAAISITGDPGLGLAQIGSGPSNASLTVNGLSVTRQSNTNLKDVVEGLTFDLKEAGVTTDVTIGKDNTQIKDKVKSFLTNFNDLINHLKLKTEPQLDEAASGENPVYKAAPLGRDLSMKTLRYNLSSKLLASFGSAASGDPRNLSEIGVDLDDNLNFELKDSSALTDALDDNFQGVEDLLNYVLGDIESSLTPYVDGNTSILSTSSDGIDERIESIDDQIDSYESRLTRREEALRRQYYGLQSQLITLQYNFQTTQAAMFGSLFGNTGNNVNQQS